MWKNLLLSIARSAAQAAGHRVIEAIDNKLNPEPTPESSKPQVRRRSLAQLLADSDAALGALLATNSTTPAADARVRARIEAERRRNQELRARIEAKIAESNPATPYNDPSLQS